MSDINYIKNRLINLKFSEEVLLNYNEQFEAGEAHLKGMCLERVSNDSLILLPSSSKQARAVKGISY